MLLYLFKTRIVVLVQYMACGLVVLLITVATISVQSARAALANPVKSLKAE